MSLAARTRGGGRVTLPNDIKLEDLTYTKARDLVGDKFEPMPLVGFFFKNGKYGKEVTLVVNRDDELLGVNIPNWYIKTFEELTDEEVKGAKRTLTAAALTYVAAAAVSLAQLLRLILLFGRRRDD